MKQMLTMQQRTVLSLIPRGAETKMLISDIAKITQLSSREVSKVISELRSKFLVPIVASRAPHDAGVFVARTEEERSMGLISYAEQLNSMSMNYQVLSKCHLDDWEKSINVDLIDFSNNDDTSSNAG